MRVYKKIGIFIVLLFLISFSGFIAWGTNAMAAQMLAKEAMKDTKNVQVMTEDALIAFIPSQPVRQGLIFYPGGRVAPEAYAPIGQNMAKEGFLTVIVPMPLNLALFGSDKALKVMENYPDISDWSIAGHSLGGAMACKFCLDHPAQVEKLILLAAYTTKSYDLSQAALPVLSVTASKDGLSTREKIEKNRGFLPADTLYYEIEGGNHAQFGDYGLQFGDGQAQISTLEQLEITLAQILAFLEG